MNLQVILLLGISGLLISYYISEYTHITHTQRLLSRKLSTTIKQINNVSTRRILGTDTLQALDPFLQFFHLYLKKGQGLQDHPHRGYDTVTYILSGELGYEDFRNNSGILYQGDTQWLTTGKGIVHAEVALTDCEMIQFWINLKRDYKFCDYYYQNLLNDDTVSSSKDGVTVKVIAGESLGRVSSIITRNPSYFIDALMEPQSIWFTDVPAGWNCLVYVLNGKVLIDNDKLKQHEVGMLSQWDTDLEVKCISKNKCRIILIAGGTADELLVAFGQFYMPNYPMAEKADRDWKTGKDGFEGSVEWKSKFNSTFK